MEIIDKDKATKIAQIINSLQQPLEYVIGASLLISQDQCFHFDIDFVTYTNIYGEQSKICKCIDCGKTN